MNPPSRDRAFPRGPLLGAGALVLLSMSAAVVGRLTGAAAVLPHSTPIAVRDLRFADRPDGGVTVTDAQADQTVTVITGQSGFFRGTVRGLAQQREREGLGPQIPFRLTAWADGRLTLDDPATHRHVELEAFGPDNEKVFARLLTDSETGK